MLRHVVLLRMGAETQAKRSDDLGRLKEALEALPGFISEVLSLRVGVNSVFRPGNWDLALEVEFADADSLEAYRVHPAHQKVLSLIDRVVADRCAVDYLV